MARKKDFQWVRDDEEPLKPIVVRTSRREKKKVSGDADFLAEALVELQSAELDVLELHPAIREGITIFHGIRHSDHGAKRRQLLYIGSCCGTSTCPASKRRLAAQMGVVAASGRPAWMPSSAGVAA